VTAFNVCYFCLSKSILSRVEVVAITSVLSRRRLGVGLAFNVYLEEGGRGTCVYMRVCWSLCFHGGT
jgi:hypothetical protein